MNNTHKGKELSASERRDYIKSALLDSSEPLTATYFAKKLSVSRQIIVSDVAILRASGMDILATPRGYISGTPDSAGEFPYVGMVACRHTAEQLREELYTIVDFGATVIDVAIEHAIYGELSGKLSLSSRYDVDLFMVKVETEKNSAPISSLTGGVHLHRIGCRSAEVFERLKESLDSKGILIS